MLNYEIILTAIYSKFNVILIFDNVTKFGARSILSRQQKRADTHLFTFERDATENNFRIHNLKRNIPFFPFKTSGATKKERAHDFFSQLKIDYV